MTGTSAAAAYISGIAAGYMDTTHNTASQMQAYLRSNFGVKIVPAQ